MHLENLLRHISNLHENIKVTIEEESNEELVFFDTLLKGNNGKICIGIEDTYAFWPITH